MTRLRAFGLAGAGAALLAAVSIALVAPRRPVTIAPAFLGTPVEPPKIAADFILTDGDGAPTHVVDRSFPATFLFFGYTHCPDECPLAMASLGHAYRALTPAQASRIRIVFVTVDPKRDSPPIVKRYVAGFGSRIVGLTGSATALAAVWRAYGVSVDAKSHEIGHGGAIYAIDASRHVVLIYPPDVAAADLAADAAILAAPRPTTST